MFRPRRKDDMVSQKRREESRYIRMVRTIFKVTNIKYRSMKFGRD